MTLANIHIFDCKLLGSLEEFRERSDSIQQDIHSWWIGNSTMLIIFVTTLAIVFLCLKIILSAIASESINSELGDLDCNEQYWLDKRSCRLLPRGYLSTLPQAKVTDAVDDSESE